MDFWEFQHSRTNVDFSFPESQRLPQHHVRPLIVPTDVQFEDKKLMGNPTLTCPGLLKS
jgi:hypothetical protein